MLLTNSQNNVERSAIDASLKHSDYDVLASKGDSLRFDKKFGPLLTYCPADNLIYYIGYEHDPTGDVTTDTDIERRIFGLDLEDSSIFKHHVKKYGDAFIDPNESHSTEFKGSLSLSGGGDFLAITCPSYENALSAPQELINPDPECPEVFGSMTGQGRFPDELSEEGGGRGLPVDGEITIEFWIKPRSLDGEYHYQTIIHHGPLVFGSYDQLNGFGPIGADDIYSEFGIFIGAGGSDWEKGKIYVKAQGGEYSTDITSDQQLDLKSTTTLEEGTWYHVAMEKKAQSGADLVTLYIDGTAEDTDTWTIKESSSPPIRTWNAIGSYWPSPRGTEFHSTYIGVQPQSQSHGYDNSAAFQFYGYFNGHINEIRVSYKAIYDGNFTPFEYPFTAIEEFTDLSKIRMLIQSDPDDASWTPKDYLGGHSITNYGPVSNVTTTGGPWGRRGYIDFAGTAGTNYAGLRTNITVGDAARPITIEFFYKWKSHSSSGDSGISHDVIIGQSLLRYLALGWTVAMEQNGRLSLNIYDQETTAMSGSPSQPRHYQIKTPFSCANNEWIHVALTVVNNDWRFYVNGQLQGYLDNIEFALPSGGNYWDYFHIGAGGCFEGSSNIYTNAGNNCYHGDFYLDDLRWTTELLYNGSEFSVPREKFKKTNGIETGLLLHLDASEEVTETTTITTEDGGYGLCTFNPLTLDTETVLKFDEPQYKDEDLGRTAGPEDAPGPPCGDTYEHERTYNIPRDIIYSAYDNCLWLLFNRHYQNYKARLVCSPPEEYAGMDGLTEEHFNSRNSFILYKYDLDSRKITHDETLWSIRWNDDSFATGWMQVDLMKDVKGLNNAYFHYPDFIRHMYTSLSINPRSGEVIGSHSHEGRGYGHMTGSTIFSYILGGDPGPPEDAKQDYENITSAYCPTGKKCINVNINDEDSIWDIDRHGESWYFTTRLNDGSNQDVPSSDFSSNNCMVYNERTGGRRGNPWRPDGFGGWHYAVQSSRPFDTGGCPKKLVFCPTTGSHYIPTKPEDAWIDFLYEDQGGSKSISDNFFLLSSTSTASVQDGIYIPSMEKILYLSYAAGQPGLIYVNPCKPTPTARGHTVAEGSGQCLIGEVGPNYVVFGRRGVGEEITSAESLIYCPSNDRIYLLGLRTLLKIRPHDLSIEESYTVPTGENMTDGKGLKTFIPVYSHVNDVIYYMSNDSQRQSFCFKPNY